MAPTTEEINATVRYVGYQVYRRGLDSPAADPDFPAAIDSLRAIGVDVRGLYDLTAMRADADLLVWWMADRVEMLQDAARRLRRTALGQTLTPVWAAVGTHRPAEFNKRHVPMAFTGAEPMDWLCVYPFVRSYDWYLLPADERSAMLREHGELGRQFPNVHASTTAAFALGDYEWILAMEAATPVELVDMMRALRSSQARLHVRQELPFFTGRRINADQVAGMLA